MSEEQADYVNDGYLYIGFDGTGYFKIGITNNPKKRIKQIRTGNPTFTYLWCFQCGNPQVREIELHTHFADKNLSGEWFSLMPEDLRYIVETYFSREGLGSPSEGKDYYFDIWNDVVNKKISLDKKQLGDSLEAWKWWLK